MYTHVWQLDRESEHLAQASGVLANGSTSKAVLAIFRTRDTLPGQRAGVQWGRAGSPAELVSKPRLNSFKTPLKAVSHRN